MAVHIRLTRKGTKKKPFYRVVATDSRSPRDGEFLEIVGTYDPSKREAACVWNTERLAYWLKQGAKPSETVGHLIPKATRA